MRPFRCAVVVLALALLPAPAAAAPIFSSFETLLDLEELTDQLAADGILFTGATALQSGALGGSLNQDEFSPASGDNVIFDASGPMRIDFATGATEFSARFTYVTRLTITAFAGSSVVATVQSLFDQNFSSSGNPQNELIGFIVAAGITHLIIEGSSSGGSFVLDDLAAETSSLSTAPIPEPATLSLLLIGAATLGGRRYLQRRSMVSPS